MGRQTDPTVQPQTITQLVDRHCSCRESGAEQLRHAAQAVRLARREMLSRAAVAHFELDVESRERETRHDVVQMCKFGAFGLQEFSARRRVVEKVTHVHRGAARMRRGANVRFFRAIHVDAPAAFGVRSSTADR